MTNKIFKAIAIFFSDVFNPFLIPIIGFFALMNFIPGAEYYSMRIKGVIYLIVFLSTCVIPLLFVLVLSLTPNFNREMKHHKDRVLPYFFSAFSIFLGAQVIARLPVPGMFRVFLLGSCIVLVIMFFITMIWKISGHAAGVGGLLGCALALTFRYGLVLNWIIVALILISGAVGASRIYLDKHKPAQVYAGFTISLLSMYLIVFFT